MDGGGAQPPGTLRWKPMGEPEDGNGKYSPDVPVTERVTDGFVPTDGSPQQRAGKVELAGECQAHERPKRTDTREAEPEGTCRQGDGHGRNQVAVDLGHDGMAVDAHSVCL